MQGRASFANTRGFDRKSSPLLRDFLWVFSLSLRLQSWVCRNGFKLVKPKEGPWKFLLGFILNWFWCVLSYSCHRNFRVWWPIRLAKMLAEGLRAITEASHAGSWLISTSCVDSRGCNFQDVNTQSQHHFAFPVPPQQFFKKKHHPFSSPATGEWFSSLALWGFAGSSAWKAIFCRCHVVQLRRVDLGFLQPLQGGSYVLVVV